MKLSELILDAQNVLEKEGDLEVCLYDEIDGVYYRCNDIYTYSIDYHDEPTVYALSGCDIKSIPPRLKVVN